MRRLTEPRELVASSRHDPLVVHLLPHVVPGAPMLATDGAVLMVYDYWDGAGTQLVGDPRACAELLTSAAPELVTDYVAVPEEAYPHLCDVITGGEPWRFRWTDVRPAAGRSPRGAWLDASAESEVEALLESSFADASARPGNRHVRRWAGIRDSAGSLVATAADCTESEVGFMASVASDVRLRRAGLGIEMTTWMTHALLDEYDVAALWQYSANTAATALYDRLGFRDEHRYLGGVLKR